MQGQQAARSQRGLGLVEVMIATTVFLLASLSVAHAFSSAAVTSRLSERTEQVKTSLEWAGESLEDLPYHQLLSWNGVSFQRDEHSVTVATNLLQPGLILLELIATDDLTGQVITRIATLRSGRAL